MVTLIQIFLLFTELQPYTVVKELGYIITTYSLGPPVRFSKNHLVGFADNISKERQYKSYCLISNESDSWKCALDNCQ